MNFIHLPDARIKSDCIVRCWAAQLSAMKSTAEKNQVFELNRHFLHAQKLKIILPNENQPRIFEAPLPEELICALDDLRKEINREERKVR